MIITFFAAIQYVFLSGVPNYVSRYAFLCMTSFIGFILTFFVFYHEIFRIDGKHILQSFILSFELFFFNLLMLIGSIGTDATIIACIMTLYFAFVPIFDYIFNKTKPTKNIIIAIIIVIIGVFFMMECNTKNLLNKNIIFLLIADIVFAMYISTTSKFSSNSNPSILAMGQLFFGFFISFICWIIDSIINKQSMIIPYSPPFWGSVIFIAFFIRGLYGVVQIFAQRYVSALNTSLIFSTEIIITLIATPFVSDYFDIQNNMKTPSIYKWIGVIVMVLGILIADGSIISRFFKGNSNEKEINI